MSTFALDQQSHLTLDSKETESPYSLEHLIVDKGPELLFKENLYHIPKLDVDDKRTKLLTAFSELACFILRLILELI